MTTEPNPDKRAALAAVGLIESVRRDGRDAVTATATDLLTDPDHHFRVTITLATIAGTIINDLHNAGMHDLADQLMQQWMNPDDPTP